MRFSASAYRRSDGRPRPLATLGVGGLLAGLLGVWSCNSLLGIGEAELQCDTTTCPSDAATPAAGASGEATPSGERAPATDSDELLEDPSSSPNGIPLVGGEPSNGGSGAEASTEPQSAGAGGSSGIGGGGAAGTSGAGVGGMGGAGVGGMGGSGAEPAAGGDPGQALCESGEPCGTCLCNSCKEEFSACAEVDGCLEIVACARNNRCTGVDCYCGSASAFECAVPDRANGPCLAVMLRAPGAHPPTLTDPNVGPASEAALDVANCTLASCASACGI